MNLFSNVTNGLVLNLLHNHTFPVREMQHKVAEFCYCFCLYNKTQISTRVAQVLGKYAHRGTFPYSIFTHYYLVI